MSATATTHKNLPKFEKLMKKHSSCTQLGKTKFYSGGVMTNMTTPTTSH